jgi:hypothetical protein
MSHPDMVQNDWLDNSRRRRMLWLGVQVVALIEGALTGAAQAGAAGALKGALVGAVFGPHFMAIVWALRRDRHRLWRTLMLGAVLEAFAVSMVALHVQQFAGMPLVVVLPLIALVAFLPWIAVPVQVSISQERRWTIGGAITGGLLGSLAAAVYAFDSAAQQGLAMAAAAAFITCCVVSVAGVATAGGAVMGAVGRANWRALGRARFCKRCRQRRNIQAETPARCRLDLADLDAFSTRSAELLPVVALLLESLRDGDRFLRLEPLGNCCRFWRQGSGMPVEQAPLEAPPAKVCGWLTSLAAFPPATPDEPRLGRLQLAVNDTSTDVLVRSKPGAEITLEFTTRGALAGEAAAVLRDYAEFFVGDPWWSAEPVRLPLQPPLDGDELVIRNDVPSAGALLRIVLAVDGWAGLAEFPIWAELDGMPVGHGSNHERLEKFLRVSAGNHLIRVWMKNTIASIRYGGRFGFMRGPAFQFTVSGPGPYQLILRARHATSDAKRKPPTFRSMSEAQVDALYGGTDS